MLYTYILHKAKLEVMLDPSDDRYRPLSLNSEQAEQERLKADGA